MHIKKSLLGSVLVSVLALLTAKAEQAEFQEVKEKRQPPANKRPEPTDLAEELPEGARARLGTGRLRALCDSLAFSADGKTIVGVDGGRLVRTWDAATGNLLESRLLAGRPHKFQWQIRVERSADGKTIVIRDGAALEMWDIFSGKRLNVKLPKDRKNIESLGISDDRSVLVMVESVESEMLNRNGGGNLGAFGGGQLGGLAGVSNYVKQQKLLVWDTKTGNERLLATSTVFPYRSLAEQGFRRALVTPDGQRVLSSTGQEVCFWNTATGKEVWKLKHLQIGEYVLTQNGQLLIGSGYGKDFFRVWNTESGQPSKAHIPPPENFGGSWILATSPQGNKLLLISGTDYVVWDLKEGKELHRWPGTDNGGNGAFSPDGQSVVTYDSVIRRFDVVTGKQLYSDVAKLGHTGHVQRFQFTTDGKRLASVGNDHTIRIWDVATSKLLHTIDLGDQYLNFWTLTPDNATLVGVDCQFTVYLWSLADGQSLNHYRLHEAQQLNIRLQPHDVRIAPDGKTLAISAWPVCPEYSFYKYSFSFWELKTGQLKNWGGDVGPKAYYRGDEALLSPDGRLVAYCGQLFDTRTGEARLALPRDGTGQGSGIHAFSPDGRLLAAGWGKRVRVWEVATMRPLIELPEEWSIRKGFSPDGRHLALADPNRFAVYDLATCKMVLERPAPEYLRQHGYFATGGIAFAPDGRTIATGHEDGTILFWDVSSIKNLGGPLTQQDLAGLWKDLEDTNPTKGRAAVWRLQQDPKAAVPFLSTKYAASKRPDEEAVHALIRELDSNRFEDREAAAKQLKKYGRAAQEVMQRALEDNPTPEQKRRLAQLLDFPDLLSPPFSGEDLRAVRVVAALEAIRTTPAKLLLEDWASGFPGERLTEEASHALTRLK
jgi:WD40 repeat protein